MIPENYIRVTEPLQMLKSYDHIDPEVLANAADRGTRVHTYCEYHVKNIYTPVIDHDCAGYVKCFIEWFDKNVEHILLCEDRLNCDELQLTGQIDLVVVLKGEDFSTVLDIKTPASESSTWKLQTAAYKYLVEKAGFEEVKSRRCLMLDRYAKPAKVFEYLDHENDLRLYLNTLELYRLFRM